MVDRDWWRERLQEIGHWLRGARWNGLGGWLQHVGMPLAAALAVLWLVGGRIWGAARRFWRRLRSAADAGRRRRCRIDFYRRFETLCAEGVGPRRRPDAPRIGPLRRRPHRRATGRQDCAELPGQLVNAYYRVRFGGLPLDNPQREAVEHGLAQLERMA